MKLPETNKIHQDKLEEKFGANADLLLKKLNEVEWKNLIKYYFFALGIFLVSLFCIIAVIRLGLKI